MEKHQMNRARVWLEYVRYECIMLISKKALHAIKDPAEKPQFTTKSKVQTELRSLY